MDRKYSKDNLKVMLAVFSYSGLEEQTHECIVAEIEHCRNHKRNLRYMRISEDALIARTRSRGLSNFLASDCDVMVMIDHDMEWSPGEVWEIGRVAFEQNAIVGGLYCKRAFGKGWSSRLSPKVGSHMLPMGQPCLVEADAVATGFMAIPREVAQGTIDRLDCDGGYYAITEEQCSTPEEQRALWDLSVGRIVDGTYKKATNDYYDSFRCIRANHPSSSEQYQYLSEDWAFCKRAQVCGYKTYISTKPMLKHHGSYAFSVTDGMDADDRAQLNG